MSSVRMTHPQDRQAGLTLIELLMAMTIMFLIVGTVAALIAFVARSTVPTSYSAKHADSVSIAAAYWAEDVAAAKDFAYAQAGLSPATLASISGSGCSSISGTAFAWLYYQPLGTSSTSYSTSVVYSYSGGTVTRTDCLTNPEHVVTLTTQYPGSPPLSINCVIAGLPQACTSRGSSTGVTLTIPMATTSSQGLTVTTTPVLTGAWMLTSS